MSFSASIRLFQILSSLQLPLGLFEHPVRNREKLSLGRRQRWIFKWRWNALRLKRDGKGSSIPSHLVTHDYSLKLSMVQISGKLCIFYTPSRLPSLFCLSVLFYSCFRFLISVLRSLFTLTTLLNPTVLMFPARYPLYYYLVYTRLMSGHVDRITSYLSYNSFMYPNLSSI